jgi:uncharacterized protein YbjQ (UPF0145 family)
MPIRSSRPGRWWSCVTDSATWEARRRSIRAAVEEIARSGQAPSRSNRAVTSDLSVDESLILHSIGWEPVDLVCGAGVFSIPQGTWTWAVGEIAAATYAVRSAMVAAARRLEDECSRVGGAGVVGVDVGISVERHAASAVLVGTAITPRGSSRPGGSPFVSDLSGQDFALLNRAGWEPTGLAFGVSYVYVPRRGAGTFVRQTGQNVELENYTRAMYAARESAMERMQQDALSERASGVVAVRVTEGPVEFASHAIGFLAWGTSVRAGAGGHNYMTPSVVLPLDDASVQFDAAHLR